MEILPKNKILRHRGLTFLIARSISNWGYKHLTKAHVEFNNDLLDLKHKGSVFLYTGLHRSLWETSGMLSALNINKLPIPVVGMGDNLIKGKLFVTLAKNTSVFLVKRGKTRREIVESARELRKNMYSFMAYGRDVLLFPEGTRTSIPRTGEYGGFFPTSFDALLEYEKDKKSKSSDLAGIKHFDVNIIPFNCDYSVIREGRELAGFNAETPRTLKIWDSLKMLKHIKDVYITFGSPIKVSDHLGKTRKEVAVMTREKCMELIKILPVNLVARALVESITEKKYDMESIYKKIEVVMKKLAIHKDKLRGFSDNSSPEKIFLSVSESIPDFRNPSPEKLSLYRLYSDYINHYFN